MDRYISNLKLLYNDICSINEHSFVILRSYVKEKLMPEKIDGKSIFSLYEVSKSIQKTLGERYTSSFWVKAEMNKLNFYRHSGHCYPELVEKKEGRVIAQFKAILWRDDYLRINQVFLRTLKEPLKDGIKILFLAKVIFDPAYGLSLSIMDIDPAFTLGDLEAEKLDTINRLKEEGIYNNNKQQVLPLLPQRIAIISVETSKGLADFLKVIETNDWNYQFFYLLFPSLLQGENAVPGIINQLRRIKKVRHHFDAVAIVRGGGGDVGLSCYNHYELAKAIAMFPLPVITGIGHATNETVSEMISFSNQITPTKLAEYLLQRFHHFSVPVQEAEKRIAELSLRILKEEKERFQTSISTFKLSTRNVLQMNRGETRNISDRLRQQAVFRLRTAKVDLRVINEDIVSVVNGLCNRSRAAVENEADKIRKEAQRQLLYFDASVVGVQQQLTGQSRLLLKEKSMEISGLEKNVNNMDPVNVLKRGYSITLLNGKAIRSNQAVNAGDTIHTQLLEGTITSIVQPDKNK